MPLTAKATIDLNALRHNLSQVKQLAPGAKVMAAIKADAYGHGVCQVAAALEQADGFAVAHLAEARQLRDSGFQQRILIMSGRLDGDDLRYCAEQHIDLVLHSLDTAYLILETPLASPLSIWFKHDSGMHRLGLDDIPMQQAVNALADCNQVAERFYMTHFSGSDEADDGRTLQQIERFDSILASLPAAPRSLANSAAIIKGNLGNSDWVRPGIMLYGANPLHPSLLDTYPVELRPVMTLKAPVLAVRRLSVGESVGYNSRWTAARESVIATIGIGYGDGYPRHAGNGTPVLINGERAPLVGVVSMDMVTVDITDCDRIQVGDEATLWGEGLRAEEIAACAGTITYELFTTITHRVPRVYSG